MEKIQECLDVQTTLSREVSKRISCRLRFSILAYFKRMKSKYIILYFNILGNFSYPCPIDKPSSWEDALINGNDGGLNEHGKNFVCRYLSFLDRDVVSPGNYFYYYSIFHEFAISN